MTQRATESVYQQPDYESHADAANRRKYGDKARDRQRGKNGSSMAGDLVKGAIAGAIAVWAMDQVGWKMYLNEDPKAFKQEKVAQIGGKYSAHVMVGMVADAAGMHLTEVQQYKAGKFAHYMLGMVPGAAYGALRKRVKGVGAGRGLLYGMTLFTLQDEIANSLLGFAAAPTAYPWQAHARGVVTHAVLGSVTDASLNVLDRLD